MDDPRVVADEPVAVQEYRAPGPGDLPDAALGAAVAVAATTVGVARAGLHLGGVLVRGGARTASAVAAWTPPPVARAVQTRVARPLGSATNDLAAAGRLTRQQLTLVAALTLDAVLDQVVPWVVAQLLDRTDLTALVAQRVDIDALVSGVDLDAAVARVDLDAAVARVDLDTAVARVDLDTAVARVDVDAVVRSVDQEVIVELARAVIDEIDLPLIIRESSGSVAADLVTDVRLQTLDADQRVARFVDRVLRRGEPAAGEPTT